MSPPLPVTPSRWTALRGLTAARIALGRAGHSLPTAALLAFQADHAAARDAVHLPFDADATAARLAALGLATLSLHSAAHDRRAYLMRPDLGRRLDPASRERLAAWKAGTGASATPRSDLALVVADGLSALAVHAHAVPVVAALLERLRRDAQQSWTLCPVAVVAQGRVAVGDEIAVALGARCVVVLLGERPGLTAPDSLGIYLSWAPQVGMTDAQRNCISNVRSAGLSVDAAAQTLHRLLTRARGLQMTGTALKDETDASRLGPPD